MNQNPEANTERRLHRLERWMRVMQNAKKTFVSLYGPQLGSGFNQERVNQWIARLDSRMNQTGEAIAEARGW